MKSVKYCKGQDIAFQVPPPCHYVTSSWSSLISQISAIPNQVKALHATEEGNSSHNGNISVPLLCVTFLGLIRSKYLTQGPSVLAPTSVVHLFHSLSFFSSPNLQHR